ncbi:MAG: hypothetical protein M3O33_16325 [Cyanobacteriota bacterium]|nr:hypothetical protein [Cyanobacteriota bacterium]
MRHQKARSPPHSPSNSNNGASSQESTPFSFVSSPRSLQTIIIRRVKESS